LAEDFGWSPEVKALAGGVVVVSDELLEAACGEGCEVSFAWQEPAHSADRVFDAALLPGRIGIAEEGVDREAAQCQVTGELGAVIEGDGLPQWSGQCAEQAQEMVSDELRGFAGQANGEQQAGLALMHGQDSLAVLCEHHEVGFPVSGRGPIAHDEGPFCHGNTAFNEAC
jgi:hypothetical protein